MIYKHALGKIHCIRLNSKEPRSLRDTGSDAPYDHRHYVNHPDGAQQLANWIHREGRPSSQEELAELRSEVPQRWLSEPRAIVGQEAESAA
jgi:hypothetical protein